MKKRALVLLTLMATVLGAIVYSPPAIAAEGMASSELTAAPEQIKYGILVPGNSYTKSFTITNTSATDLTFKLSAVSHQDIESDNAFTKITEWLTFPGITTEYTLKPEASANINIRIKIPKDAPVGGQYASILAIASDQTFPLASISAIINGEGLKHSGELVSQSLTSFSLSPQINSLVQVRNTGNTDFEAVSKLTIKSIFGGDPIFETSSSTPVLPSVTAEIHQDWTNAPTIGIFSATQTTAFVNANSEQVERTTDRIIVICPIWLIITVIVVILAIIALIVVLKIRHHGGRKTKKNHKKASWEQENI